MEPVETYAVPWEGAVRPRVHVDVGRCAGCQECVVRCPTGALSLDAEAWQARAEDALCVGCRQCERTCPFHAVEVEGPVLSGQGPGGRHVRPSSLYLHSKETRRSLTWEEAMGQAERCLNCPDPTCVLGCPAGNDIPGFLAAVRTGELRRAAEILRATSLFPDICSRVCDQSTQCEGACSWGLAGGEPIPIGLLERFVAEHAPPEGPRARSRLGAGLSVAVVGAGPAGLAAAWDLLEAGCDVTLYERRNRALGVLDWGIPDFTLPRAVAERPLRQLEEAGVAFVYGADVGGLLPLARLMAEHDAVILAAGASQPMRTRAQGADRPWVEDATAFLTRAKAALSARRPLPDLGAGSRLLVLGAGNTAMDVARTAIRLGVRDVTAIDWVDRRFAKVRPDELAEACAEGVQVRFLTSLVRVEEERDGTRVAYLAQTRQRSARTLPRVLPTPPERMVVDRIVVAMGYVVEGWLTEQVGQRLPVRVPTGGAGVPDRRLMASGVLAAPTDIGIRIQERRRIEAKAQNPVAGRVWVVGDALGGPATVVQAMAQARAAVRAVLAARPHRPRTDEQAQAEMKTAGPDMREVAAGTGAGEARDGALLALGGTLVTCGALASLTIVGLAVGVPLVVSGGILLGVCQLSRWVGRGVGAMGLGPVAGSRAPSPRPLGSSR